MTEVETKRGRVRRLLIDPLASGYGGMGFRFPKGVDEKKQRSYLDWLADWLGYLSDEELKRLRSCLSVHGAGASKTEWPSRGTIAFFAQAARARPLETWPECASWFASVEGPKAKDEGTLVATLRFIERNVRPPYSPKDRALVADDAKALLSEYEEAKVRLDLRRGFPSDEEFVRWYDQQLARAEALIGGAA